MPNERKMMEQTTYEDMVRSMMGKNAYLMFVFGGLLSAVSSNKSITLLFRLLKTFLRSNN